MPYRHDDTGSEERILVWPHRSLPPEGFATVIGVMFGFALLPLLSVLGSPVLWGLLPFAMGSLALLWYFLRRNYRDAQMNEVLTLGTDKVELVRTNVRGPAQRWEANPYWVRVALHPESGPVKNYITLHGGDRDVEIGAFLTPEERVGLFEDLNRAFSKARTLAHP